MSPPATVQGDTARLACSSSSRTKEMSPSVGRLSINVGTDVYMISLLWSIGTVLTRCDFDLGSEQAWRNERLALSGMAVVFVQRQFGCSTGLGPVEAYYGTSFRAISTFIRPDGDNILMPLTTCRSKPQLKAPPTRWSLRDRTRFFSCGHSSLHPMCPQ